MSNFKLINHFYDKIEDILDNSFKWIKVRRKGYSVLNVACSFDIETTTFIDKDVPFDNKLRGTMYCFVLGINGKCIRGRKWEDLDFYLKRIIEFYHVDIQHRLYIYVHNLAFEFQWFRKRFIWEEVFSIEERRPIYALTADGICFRCSYVLSGYKLEKLGENLQKYKVKKLVGDLDYNLLRHSNTPLTDTEWSYVLNDGLVVMAYIQELIERLGDITKIPNTKTSFVRIDLKRNCFSDQYAKQYFKLMKRLTLTESDYLQLKRVYQGGFTHANHNWVDKIMSDVTSMDFTSSYPAAFISEKYPMSKFYPVMKVNKYKFNYYLKYYACLFNAKFHNLKAKVSFEHFISRSKCFNIEHFYCDNGRVVNASLLEISLNEIDFEIICQYYTWDFLEISELKVAVKDYLPRPVLLTILEYYQKKTTLKGVEGKEVEYLNSKEMLNSLYGMMCTDISRWKITYESIDDEWSSFPPNRQQELDLYNKAKGRTISYAWGVWNSAYARRNLHSGILSCKEDYIYSDTDSIKCINYNKHKEYFDRYNENIILKIKDCCEKRKIDFKQTCPKTIKGVTKQIGVWDFDGHYKMFKTLGAKRYIMLDDSDHLKITIAGVNKESGAKYLVDRFKNMNDIFNHFTNKLVFPAYYKDKDNNKKLGCGKLMLTYIDFETKGNITDYLGNKYQYQEESSLALTPTSYSLDLNQDFVNYITSENVFYMK